MPWIVDSIVTAEQLSEKLNNLWMSNQLADIGFGRQLPYYVPVHRAADGLWLIFKYIYDRNALEKRGLDQPVRFKNKATGKFIGISQASKSKDTRALQWDSANDGSQDFILERSREDSPFIFIKNVNSGLYLGVSNASEADKALIIQWPEANDGSQEWLFGVHDDGYVKIFNPHSRKVWAIAEGSKKNGELLIQWSPLNIDDQLWEIEQL